MRLPIGHKCRVILEDGTTAVGTPARSWRWGVRRLNTVTMYARVGEVEAPPLSYLLIPDSRIMFVQVGAE